MKKYLYYVCILFMCFLQYSCVVQSMESLVSYRPKRQIIEEFYVLGQDKIKITSNCSYSYYDMYEWEESDSSNSEGYMIYVIEIWQGGEVKENNTKFVLELVSVEVTECGNPLPFSIFQKTYPGEVEPVPIIAPYALKDRNNHKFFVKIKKAERDLCALSIKYHIKINDIPVIKEHQYRREYSIQTKHLKLFKSWLHNCH